MTRLMIAAVLCCFGIVSTVSAADAEKKKKKAEAAKGPDIAMLFEKLDVNKDKKIDVKEFEAFTGLEEPKKKKAEKAKAVAVFVADKADKAAKKAKKAEAAAELVKKRAEWFKKLDANNDGSLTVEEFGKVKDVVGTGEAKKKKAA